MRNRYSRKASSASFTTTAKRVLLPGLLIVAVSLLSAKDAFHFNNGSGGAEWKIGKPKVSLLTAHNNRSLPEIRQFALLLVNRDRQINGLLPLVEDPLLSQSSQQHSQDMMSRNYYAHVTPEGKTPTARFTQVGGRGGVGENIMKQTGGLGVGLNYGLIESFQKSWMYSTGHRQNLLKPEYTRFGYGIVVEQISGRAYAVQNFATEIP